MFFIHIYRSVDRESIIEFAPTTTSTQIDETLPRTDNVTISRGLWGLMPPPKPRINPFMVSAYSNDNLKTKKVPWDTSSSKSRVNPKMTLASTTHDSDDCIRYIILVKCFYFYIYFQ